MLWFQGHEEGDGGLKHIPKRQLKQRARPVIGGKKSSRGESLQEKTIGG
jgi:hypothetical protein